MVKRYESGKYAIDDSVTKEYLKVRNLGFWLNMLKDG